MYYPVDLAMAMSKASQLASIIEKVNGLKGFFDRHKGADSFLWDSPLDGEVRVKTGTSYQPRQVGGLVWSISTTFTQTFQP